MKKYLYSQGQSLVEMVVVIGIVVTLAVGIIAGTTAVLGGQQDTQIRSNATKYATEGIELTRDLRDDSWNKFEDLGVVQTSYCVGDDGEFVMTVTTCSARNIGDLYTRMITLELLPENASNPIEKMLVRVLVFWGAVGTSADSVELETYLTQWR